MAGRFRAAYANLDILKEMSGRIREQKLSLKVIKDSHLALDAESDKSRELMFTIPYDIGWTCYVDGVKRDLKQVIGVFMACDIEAGSHHIEMIYVPDGLIAGRNIAIGAFIILMIYLIFGRRFIDRCFIKENHQDNTPELESDSV